MTSAALPTSKPCAAATALTLLALSLALPHASAAEARKPRAAEVQTDGALDVVTYGRREDLMRWGEDVAQRRGLDVAWVQSALAQSKFMPSVARAIMPAPAGTAKNWAAYRDRFVEPKRIKAGLAFWRANEAWLTLAEQRYGVPAEIIVGIIGVESLYGQQMGNFRVVDALATLAFDFPTGRKDRSEFFREELESFLLLCKKEGVSPLKLKGSYAGAMGMPQFMPSSVNLYAVDFDGDGHVNLHGNAADVIGSVAHYLAEFGWQRDLPTHFDVDVPVDANDRAALLGPDILPTFTPLDFAERGARLGPAGLSTGSKLALVELQNGPMAASYVAGTTNFYAVTRYNWSSYYAMAVIALGEAVRLQR